MINGIYTALVTPFVDQSFGIQESLWRKLIERQIQAGVDGIVVAGSTGEGQTMYPEEWESSLRIACDYRDQIQVMASVGASATWQVVDRIKRAKEFRAHSVLISSPPYNKPTQAGIIEHFREASKACTDMPIMIYNIPGRTAVNISPATMKELWKIPSVQSLKESSGDWGQFLQMMEDCPKDKSILSGDDPAALSFWTHGGKGLVSVLSNVAPTAVVKMWKHFQSNELSEARKIFFELQTITRLLFCETNPIPTKFLVGEILKSPLTPRLPLLPLSSPLQAALKAELSKLKEKGWIA